MRRATPRALVPSKKVTKAGGTGPGGNVASTPAVICTFWPTLDAFGQPETSAVVAPSAEAGTGEARTKPDVANSAATRNVIGRNQVVRETIMRESFREAEPATASAVLSGACRLRLLGDRDRTGAELAPLRGRPPAYETKAQTA